MFQKSLLKNFVKSFKTPNFDKIYEFVTKNKFIAEDANGAEFLALLGKFLNWNYKREVKNSTDSKKADGVIFDKNNNPIAIIELKSSNKDISNRDIIAQAFRYKNEKPNCEYVFISNFKQFDIYIDSSDKCFSIDLTKRENYPILYALTNQNIIQTHALAKLKENSKTQEEITKEVYKKYSEFRLNLINNLLKNNPTISKEEILHAVNKLLDRFMFILFAEDRGLIPANTIFTIIKHYEETHKWGDETPLYEYYKKYFQFIDKGNEKLNIPKYNGNLFKPDKLVESLIIDNEIIKDDLATLSAYDFSEDIDVEVLGHIFEQSLSDLEAIKEELIEGHKIVDKRKKDGVFYTPKFVTEFIVKNTVEKLCEEKKRELKLQKPTIKKLHKYREFLDNLKIVDPACGSGAFLNAAFRYLLKEHEFIKNELIKSGANLFEFMDVDKEIIEKNLFGVDINEASVGITKLSLWLQTAKRDRALSDLSSNIKCANSLSADWNELFAEIMSKGGFDVVIGNPPYVRQERIKDIKPILKKLYKVFSGTADLFVYFYELAYNILKENGLNGFICSNKFFRAKYGKNLRELILTKTSIKNIVDFSGVKVFEDASVDSAITILKKGYKKDNIFKVCLKDFQNCFEMKQDDLSIDSFVFVTPKELEIKKKIEKLGTPLKNWDIKINFGIKTGLNEAFIIDEEKKNELIKKDNKSAEIIKPLLRGRDIKKYECDFKGFYLINTHNNPSVDVNNYPAIKEHLYKYFDKLAKRSDKGATLYNLRNCAYLEDFEKEKIVFSRIVKSPQFCFDTKKFYIEATGYILTGENLKYITAFLNSDFIYKIFYKFYSGGGIDGEIKINKFEKLPIPKLTKNEQQPFINLVDIILTSKEKIKKYKKYLDKLTPTEKIEILDEIEKLEKKVNESISKIDEMVYKLYNLNNEEIKIIEKF